MGLIDVATAGRLKPVNDDLTETMSEISQLMLASDRRNFIEGGRPSKWPVLKTGMQSYLFRTGAMLQGIHADSDKYSATGSTSPWVANAIHQWGGWAGRGHKSYIPARPYNLFQEEDIVKYQSMIKGGIINTTTETETYQ